MKWPDIEKKKEKKKIISSWKLVLQYRCASFLWRKNSIRVVILL